MRLLFAGDLVPTKSNIDAFRQGDISKLMDDGLQAVWHDAQVRVFNLEAPLYDGEASISKTGPSLIVPTQAINGIAALEPTLVTLANNHIMDHSQAGLASTFQQLDGKLIPHIGADMTLAKAAGTHTIQKENKAIGIYACCENEFSIATEKSPGANPFDALESFDHVAKLSVVSDYTVVLFHGGKELYPYPSPKLQKICRKFVDKGADLVLCQHSHCIGAKEVYEGATIVYGQGNFIFDASKRKEWDTGLMVSVDLNDDVQVDVIPYYRHDGGIRLATDDKEEEIRKAFEGRTEKIKDKAFIQAQYDAFSEKHLVYYLTQLHGSGKWISRIDRHLLKNFLLKRIYSKRRLNKLQNYMECEAHYELMLNAIKRGQKEI